MTTAAWCLLCHPKPCHPELVSGSSQGQGDLSNFYGFGPGAFGYVDFREDGTYIIGDGKKGVKNLPDSDPTGSYKGDPSADGTIYVTGVWGNDPVVNLAIEISNGTFDLAGLTMIRQ